jgi:hypothetical protein
MENPEVSEGIAALKKVGNAHPTYFSLSIPLSDFSVR